jgi:alpha-L-fucosidase
MKEKSLKQLFYSVGLTVFLTGILVACGGNVEPPAPFGAIPNQKQLDWQKLEYYMFIHFGPNTFTHVEWGDGQEDPNVFYPTNLDVRQWAETAKNAGMRGIIITAKHHDGFCLWPSNYSTHTVRESRWRDGQGDILRELSDACREFGLLFGVYLSPWDQNHPTYGLPEYNQVFVNTLRETLTQYGDVFTVWFDGANGNALRGEVVQDYDWDLFHETVRRYQPNAVIFSDVGPDIRWIGNESGFAGETNWSTLNIEGYAPGLGAPHPDVLNSGNRNGAHWIPGETNVSIRPGWFYTPETNDRVKSLEHLVDIWYTSVGRNSNLLLNVPPTAEGRIHPNDSTRLMELREVVEKSFANDLMQGARISASNTRGNSSRFGTRNLTNGNFHSYWAADDDVTQVSFEIRLPRRTEFNRLQVQEYIPLGQRVAAFTIDIWDEELDSWREIASETTIGFRRIVRFPKVEAQRLRLNINESLASPVLSSIALFDAIEFLTPPRINRNQAGMVMIDCIIPDPAIFFTTDGSIPTASSYQFEQPFALPAGGVVRAVAMLDNNTRQSEIVTVNFDIASTNWTVLSPQIPQAIRAIDGNLENRVFIENGRPLIIDLGETLDLRGFIYTPSIQVGSPNIYYYTFSVSNDNVRWRTVIREGRFDNIRNSPIPQEVIFDNVESARYIRLESLVIANPGEHFTVSEVSVITR